MSESGVDFRTTPPSDSALPELDQLVALVLEATKETLRIPRSPGQHEIKIDGSLVTDVDLAIQSRLKHSLDARWPQFGFIGEEMEYEDQVSESVSSRAGYWVLDPLDGTTNFSSGFLFYGVSLALVIEGVPVMGVVYDPVRDECFSAAKGKGARLNGEIMRSPEANSLSSCIANVDYKRLVADLAGSNRTIWSGWIRLDPQNLL